MSTVFELDDLGKEIGGIMCFYCRHLSETKPLTCAAFPDGIPSSVWHGVHTAPFPGDNGIVFDEMTEEEVEARSNRFGRKEELPIAK